MDRKKFLRDAGFALSAGIMLPSFTRNPPLPQPYSLDNWLDIRNQFLLEKDKIHMAQMLFASHPTPVREAIEFHRKKFDANPAEYWEHNFQTAEPKVLQSAAAYLDANPAEIALTDSTTQGLGILYTGLKLRSGDEYLLLPTIIIPRKKLWNSLHKRTEPRFAEFHCMMIHSRPMQMKLLKN